MEDRLDVVAVRIEDERGVVAPAVLGTKARRSVVYSAVAHRGLVPAYDRVFITCTEGDVRPRSDPVAAGLDADGMKGEVVVVLPPEQYVGVALELALRQHPESELWHCGGIHPAAGRQVAHSDPHVVDDLAHLAITIDCTLTWTAGG